MEEEVVDEGEKSEGTGEEKSQGRCQSGLVSNFEWV